MHILYIGLHMFPVISNFAQRFWSIPCTVLRRTITPCVKLLITCKLCSVSNSIKASGSSGWCKYFYVHTCESIGLCRTFTHCTLAALARKTIAYPKTNPSCVRFSVWRQFTSNLRTCRFSCEVGLAFYERAERASND